MYFRHPINLFLCSLVFLLLACHSDEKEFMTPKPGEIVFDVNVNEYSLNGTVIGKTAADISNNDDDLLIKPLCGELQKIIRLETEEALRKGVPADESKEKLHVDENLPYIGFYKVIATSGFCGYTSIQYVIGSNFKEPLAMDYPERSLSSFLEGAVDHFNCRQAGNQRKKLSEKTSHKENLTVEIMDRRIKDTELLIECARRYINLSLSINSKGEGFSYALGLNETGLIDGEKFYTYENLDDVWKFIEDIRLRPGMQDKEDWDLIVVTLENDILVKNLAPVVKKLKSVGYKVNLAILGG